MLQVLGEGLFPNGVIRANVVEGMCRCVGVLATEEAALLCVIYLGNEVVDSGLETEGALAEREAGDSLVTEYCTDTTVCFRR